MKMVSRAYSQLCPVPPPSAGGGTGRRNIKKLEIQELKKDRQNEVPLSCL